MKKILLIVGLIAAATVLHSLYSAYDQVECTVEEVEIVSTRNIVTGEPVLEGKVYPSCVDIAISYREKVVGDWAEARRRLDERLPKVGDAITVSRRKAGLVEWRERHEAYSDNL